MTVEASNVGFAALESLRNKAVSLIDDKPSVIDNSFP